jgi:hypothetical protein
MMTSDNRLSRTLSPLHQFWGKVPGVMNVKAIITNHPKISPIMEDRSFLIADNAGVIIRTAGR